MRPSCHQLLLGSLFVDRVPLLPALLETVILINPISAWLLILAYYFVDFVLAVNASCSFCTPVVSSAKLIHSQYSEAN